MKPPADDTSDSPFQWPDFRCLFVVDATVTLASRALAVVVGYQVFELTKNPLSLGMLGLVEAIPALSLALYGGHIADRHERRSILIVTLATLTMCAAALAGLSAASAGQLSLTALYAVVFVAGIARGFAEPAASAMEAQVVPPHLMVQSSTWLATAWLSCSIIGPVFGGVAFATCGASVTYLLFTALYFTACIAVSRITRQPVKPHPEDESIWQSIAVGVKYVATNQVLLGSMALDLFAVLFGGAIAILPVFAKEILHVGPVGLGFLNAAPNAGALCTMLIATRYPPVKHAGRNLMLSVAGFGVSMIVFALSENLYLSLITLFMSGVFDGVSVVIRRSILRIMSPEHLRGRIAAVSMVFIGSSNELGAFESGLAAAWFGTIRSVFGGGVLTLCIVFGTACMAPKLRQLSLEPHHPPREE